MKIKIDLTDRLHKQIVEYCNLNNIKLNTYLADKVEEGFSVDRFGDLNKLSGNIPTENRCEITRVTYENDTGELIIVINENNEKRINLKLFNLVVKDTVPNIIEQTIEESKQDDDIVVEETSKQPKIRKRVIKTK